MRLAESNGCNNIKVQAALQLQSCAQCFPQHSQWQLYNNHPNPQKVVLNSGCTTTTRSYLLHAPCIASAIYPIMLCLSLCTHWSQHSINQHSPFPLPLTWHQLCNKWGHVGFAYNEHSCTPVSSNHHSAIAEALDIEVTKWAIWIAHVIQEATCISR